MQKILTPIALGTTLVLTGCGQGNHMLDNNPDSAFSSNYGVAYENNFRALNGDLQREMAANLTRVFASKTPATINFEFNSSNLDSAAQAALREQAAWMKTNPNITFKVFGHTDAVGSTAYNQSLGLRRAQTAVNFLIRQGVDRRKVRAVVSYGEERPLVLTQDRNRENRRTVTEVEGFYNPTGEPIDGRYATRIYNSYTGAVQEVVVSQAGTSDG